MLDALLCYVLVFFSHAIAYFSPLSLYINYTTNRPYQTNYYQRSAHIKAVVVETVETVEEKMIYQQRINQRLIQHHLPSIGNKMI